MKNDPRGLERFHKYLGTLRFFDPACGCGNFLLVAYRELRRLEIKILKQLQRHSPRSAQQLEIDVSRLCYLNVDAMYGIELEEFPSKIAEIALWITDHQMNMELSTELGGQTLRRIPLRKRPSIQHGNALTLRWELLIKKPEPSPLTTLFIFGNPPFAGKKRRSREQNEDMEVTCFDVENRGLLDYVAAWFIKAQRFIHNTSAKVAFLATNSVAQGEQVGVLWKHLLKHGVHINFAHRTFRWTSESQGASSVYCVVIGFSEVDAGGKKIFDYETPASLPNEIKVKRINPYLVEGEDTIIQNLKKPLCDVPEMRFGNMPNDGGNLLFSIEEKREFLNRNPESAKFFHQLLCADEFLNGQTRWCLWLKDVDPSDIKSIRDIMKRVELVKEYRNRSDRAATKRLASTPSLFAEIRQPEKEFILLPRHSSENRRYVPIGFFSPKLIVHDSCLAISGASLYHFGILTSAAHMAWMRQTCGRIKNDYRYSTTLVYNNFPWPLECSTQDKAQIEELAKHVLSKRDGHGKSSLSDLYDPLLMPKPLRNAHEELDAAVDKLYSGKIFKSELERFKFLFDLHRQYIRNSTLKSGEQYLKKAA